jgi:hypothetical protein
MVNTPRHRRPDNFGVWIDVASGIALVTDASLLSIFLLPAISLCILLAAIMVFLQRRDLQLQSFAPVTSKVRPYIP